MRSSFLSGAVPGGKFPIIRPPRCSWRFATGMDERETAELTLAMTHSGEMADLSAIPGRKADKHSTGGVGDKTTLIAGPLAAGLWRDGCQNERPGGLGYTGGTIDKLEAIPGFFHQPDPGTLCPNRRGKPACALSARAGIWPRQIKSCMRCGCDATVESIPCIASSIMSKKLPRQ